MSHDLDFRSLTIEFLKASIVFPAKGDRFPAIGNLGDPRHFDAAGEPQGEDIVMSKKFPAPRPLTDEEEAEIQHMIASDPDAPELTDEQMSKGRPFGDVFPDLQASITRSRGRPRSDTPKAAVTLRLEPATIARFQALGKDWRTKMAEALEKAAP